MKIYHNYILLGCLSCFLLASCSKDLGNYDYHDINELTITGIEESYTVTTSVDTLRINAQITATESTADESLYDYYWIIRHRNDDFVDTIGTDRNLVYPVDLAPESDPYKLYFRAVDHQTGVTWSSISDLTVGTAYSRGILIIGENEAGEAEAEMLSMVKENTVHIKNILSNSGLPTLHDPVNFYYMGGGFLAPPKLWVLTNTGSYYFDRITMKSTTDNRFSDFAYVTDPIDIQALDPIVIAPQGYNEKGDFGDDYNRVVLCSDGTLFGAHSFLNGGAFYTNPVNRTAEDKDRLLKAAPYLLYPIGRMRNVVWYDTENERFLYLSNIGLSTESTVLTDEAGDPFPWNQDPVGRTLVYAENTRNTDGGSTHGNSFAIAKDGDNRHYLYKFYADGADPVKHASYTVLPIATDFDKADFYAFSSNRTVVFYSVGNRLYAYDYNPGNEKIYQISTIGTDEITMLKFDTQINALENALYIATYNSGTKGTLRRFIVGSNPNVVALTPAENAEWNGLIKVKNINWRAAD